MDNATIVVERPRGGTRGPFVAFTVMPDGQPAGSLDYGGHLRLEVEPGHYRVWLTFAQNPLYRSNPVRVDVPEGARCVLAAGTSDRLFAATDSGSEWMRLGPGSGGTPDARVTVLDRTPARSRWLPQPATDRQLRVAATIPFPDPRSRARCPPRGLVHRAAPLGRGHDAGPGPLPDPQGPSDPYGPAPATRPPSPGSRRSAGVSVRERAGSLVPSGPAPALVMTARCGPAARACDVAVLDVGSRPHLDQTPVSLFGGDVACLRAPTAQDRWLGAVMLTLRRRAFVDVAAERPARSRPGPACGLLPGYAALVAMALWAIAVTPPGVSLLRARRLPDLAPLCVKGRVEEPSWWWPVGVGVLGVSVVGAGPGSG
jgi:hypothetical protein